MPVLEVDTAIIGGGMLGWSAAYPLVKAGQRIVVVDRADEGHATQAGAGIIAPSMNLHDPESMRPLLRAAVAYYPEIVRLLADDGEVDSGYEVVGALFIARNQREADALPALALDMIRRRDNGLENVGEVTLLDTDAAQRLFPALGEIDGAVHSAGAARVDGRILRAALRSATLRLGAESIIGDTEILAMSDTTIEIRTGTTTIRAAHLIVAAGAWSGSIASAVGFELPVFPQRGQIIHLDMPNTYTGDWPIVVGYSDRYLLSFRPNRVVVGATRESDAGFDVRPTAGGIRSILDEALNVAPGLADSTVAEIRVGLRPFSPDHRPVLGAAPGHPNVLFCTGHGPSGLQLGPFSGRLVAGLVLGETPSIDISPFAPGRFQFPT